MTPIKTNRIIKIVPSPKLLCFLESCFLVIRFTNPGLIKLTIKRAKVIKRSKASILDILKGRPQAARVKYMLLGFRSQNIGVGSTTAEAKENFLPAAIR
ncbi:hypothetical protein A2697_01405 [Candidatus Curtissbacteria bacterium RIFCSPHIGHO2_01_FULL_41_44]|uniref:Uncharacterized protein n=1 Tax=Candidatus Curtissbacteria bacterium RIFCSPLOWO2_01_FULL_42_50 TaxID=1797730 RepID=A0A1F5H3F7_9BACT|nr:MAG: hypothetical protein A3C33_00620 [Candidatus Curtissbacteria bacterium RIFCSPHIGHO2_02_FULL_42_58]OGD94566.1 MAG: hypothetical protein A2697_01405 [Candidatus Curtissbacteria bacterium RIFCSPHIGHO2_01_FULL_41_44]OGD97949.1 MAG: hypothetical protein A3E71_03880 [Candidatus Curtissbacteria bacterium RIFCSPHIGHO2_12_FULL_42_33]OGD98599.1 MAG: hypothetical protein A3B54_05450 [Candidatus Curtissbacteria bacterium RIFCSPLOWO2_01_FULL_42_50]OGE11202.1 MAG: hypothetical protein A3H87_01525 [Ca